MFRAFHHGHDQPLIFDDPVAKRLLGPGAYAKLAERFSQTLADLAPERAANSPD